MNPVDTELQKIFYLSDYVTITQTDIAIKKLKSVTITNKNQKEYIDIILGDIYIMFIVLYYITLYYIALYYIILYDIV